MAKLKAMWNGFWRYRYLLWNLVSRDFKLKSVSYTHLDVYKRQPWVIGIVAERAGLAAGMASNIVPCVGLVVFTPLLSLIHI